MTPAATSGGLSLLQATVGGQRAAGSALNAHVQHKASFRVILHLLILNSSRHAEPFRGREGGKVAILGVAIFCRLYNMSA